MFAPFFFLRNNTIKTKYGKCVHLKKSAKGNNNNNNNTYVFYRYLERAEREIITRMACNSNP